MKNFNRDGGFGNRNGGGNFGRRDSGGQGFNRGGNNSSRPTMHKAICAECGQSCEVPFKPTGDRPIFCSNCFKGKDNPTPQRSSGRDFSKPNFSDKRPFTSSQPSNEQLEMLNSKLDKILSALNLIIAGSINLKEKSVSEIPVQEIKNSELKNISTKTSKKTAAPKKLAAKKAKKK